MHCDMTPTKGNLRNMFVLLVHAVILTLCSCAAINTSQLSTRDDGADKLLLLSAPNPIWDRYTKNRIDWNRFTTRKPIDWNRLTKTKLTDWNRFTTKKPTDWRRFTTRRPTVWNRVTTRKPIDWNEFIEKPSDWKDFIEKLIDSKEVTEKRMDWGRTTWNPIDRNTLTMKPLVPNKVTKGESNTGVKIIVWILLTFLETFVGGAFYILCKRYVCPTQNSTYESIPTVNPPPTRIIPPSQNTRQNQTSSSQIRTIFGNTRDNSRAFQGTDNYAFTRDDAEVPISNNANDKPPDYCEVVIRDFGSANAKTFAEVAPKIPDTAPPKYEGNIWKY